MLGLACLALGYGVARGQTGRPTQAPPASGPVVPRLTREELIRKFVLNRDGKIDQGELEVASSKMRLERAEMRLSRGVDPVTGLPRDTDPGGLDPDETEPPPLSIDELARRLGLEPPEQEAPPAAPPTPAAGERPLQPRIFGLTLPARSAAGGVGAAATPSVPGGIRAGGRPALPGYGSGVRPPSLNAGRADQLPSVTADRQRVAGGLVPRLQPSRPAPPPPPAPPPQRTVEDFNVY